MSIQTETSIVETEAMRTFGGKELLVERPSGMNIDTYKVLLKEQSRLIKKMFTTKPSRKLLKLIQ